MELKLTPLVDLDYGNGHYLAVASLLAYGDDMTLFEKQLGLTAQLIPAGNIKTVVAEDDSNIVVVFRGTESPLTADGRKDWLLTNARQQLISPPAGEFGADFAAIDL